MIKVGEILVSDDIKEVEFVCHLEKCKGACCVEGESGAIVGLKIKAGATVNAGDFRGLRKLSEASGNNFKLGLVLYDSESTIPFGKNMFAAPISCVWG